MCCLGWTVLRRYPLHGLASLCDSRQVPITKLQLAALLAGAHHVPERERVAAFIREPATQLINNPFFAARAGVARNTWACRSFDLRAMGAHAAGVKDLVDALAELTASEPLTEEVARSGPHTASVFLSDDGGRVVGVALYGKPGISLTLFVVRRPRRRRSASAQLNLFADCGL